jgi:hypothetical protein
LDSLTIIGTPHTPAVDFDPDNNYFIISGRSTSQDSDIQYLPIVRYLEIYKKELDQINKIQKNSDGQTITFRFKFEYFNTQAIRYLHTIMKHIEDISQTNQVSVIWESERFDEDNIEMGEEFEELFNIDIRLIVNEIPQKRKKTFTHKFKDVE